MDCLREFRTYIERKVEDINDEIKNISQYEIIKGNLDLIYSYINNGEYDRINYDDLMYGLGLVFSHEDVLDRINKFKEAINIVNLFKGSNIPQVAMAFSFLNEFSSIIFNTSRSLEASIYERKSKIDEKKSYYDRYLYLVNDGEIVRHLDQDELKEFFAFLEDSSLEKKTILDLTMVFMIDSLDYAEKLRNLRIANEERIKRENTRVVKEKIESKNTGDVLGDIPDILNENDTLTSEEENIYNRILEIVNVLEREYSLSLSGLGDLLKGDYSLDSRIKVYDSAEEKLSLLLWDVKVNLLPNFRENKDSIIKIFEYFIDIFDKEYSKKEESTFVSQIPDFSEKEKKEIDEYLAISEKEIERYNGFSENDKNMIHSMWDFIKENSESDVQLSEKFSINYVKSLSLFMKFKSLMDEYYELRENEEDYVASGLQNDIDSCLSNQMNAIRELLNRIKKENEIKTTLTSNDNDSLEENDSVVSDYTPDRKTLLVFLPLKDGNYSIVDDQKSILSLHDDKLMKRLKDGLFEISRKDFYSFVSGSKSNNIRVVNHEKMIEDYASEVKPFRFRKGDVRFIYTKLSLTERNQAKIKEAYGLEKADVLLVIECIDKLSLGDTYARINRRIASEISMIRYMFDLFGHDFDEASFKTAIGLIDDSDKLCERLFKNPMKLLDSDSLNK